MKYLPCSIKKFFNWVSGFSIENVIPKVTVWRFKVRWISYSIKKVPVQTCGVRMHCQNKWSFVSISTWQKSQRVDSPIPHFCKYLFVGIIRIMYMYWYWNIKVNRNVQGVPQLQTAANPRHQEEEKMTKTTAYKTNKQMHEKYTDQPPLPQARWSQCWK